jgi:hypothetical protein
MKEIIQKHSTNNTKHSKYNYTYYQNTHTIVKTPTHYKTHIYTNSYITKPTYTQIHTLQNPRIHTHITKPTYISVIVQLLISRTNCSFIRVFFHSCLSNHKITLVSFLSILTLCCPFHKEGVH